MDLSLSHGQSAGNRDVYCSTWLSSPAPLILSSHQETCPVRKKLFDLSHDVCLSLLLMTERSWMCSPSSWVRSGCQAVYGANSQWWWNGNYWAQGPAMLTHQSRDQWCGTTGFLKIGSMQLYFHTWTPQSSSSEHRLRWEVQGGEQKWMASTHTRRPEHVNPEIQVPYAPIYLFSLMPHFTPKYTYCATTVTHSLFFSWLIQYPSL